MRVKGNTMKICLIALLGLSALALAQRPARNFEGGFRGLFRGKVVINEPYSGVGVTTLKRTLSDGNTINESNCVKVYRDSSGRTRREETRNSATCSATPSTMPPWTPNPITRRVNWSITTRTQCVFKVADSHRNKSQLHRLSLVWPRNVSQDGPRASDSGR